MKARLPDKYDYSRGGKRKKATGAAMMLFARALSDYGFSANMINAWVSLVYDVTCEIAEFERNCISNKTWQDEVTYWGEKMGFDLPKNYVLAIRGSTVMGIEQMVLVLLELYALTKMGYGEVRLKRILKQYAEISNLYGDGIAKYSKNQLEEWCREKGVCLC